MVPLVTRETGSSSVGRALTNTEVDNNFINLNNEIFVDSFPTVQPTLNLNFANGKKLDPRIDFVRTSSATYYDGVTTVKAEENLLLNSVHPLNSTWAMSGGYAGAIGSELVTNGTFNTDVSGWSTLVGSPIFIWDNGVLRLTQSVQTLQNYVYQAIPVTANASYYFKINHIRVAGSASFWDLRQGSVAAPGTQHNDTSFVGAEATSTFNATRLVIPTATYLYVQLRIDQSDNIATYDNISIRRLTADNATAPDGTSTAVTLTAEAANATFTQSVSLGATSYTFSVWLKRTTGTGNVDITCDSAGTWVTQTITSSWARYTVTQTLAAGTRNPGIRIATSGDQVQVWGAQLEQRSSATAYTVTNAPIASGTELVTNGDFSSGTSWTLGAGWSISSGALNGATGAFSVTSQTGAYVAGRTYRVQLDITCSAGYVNVYINSGTGYIAQTTAKHVFYLVAGSSGTLLSLGGASFTGTIDNISVQEITSYTAGPITNYIPQLLTAPANTPRFDHNPVTGASLGLLVEESRTNLLLYSSDFDNNTWVKVNTSINANTVIAPDGTLSGDKLVITSTAAQHVILQNVTTVTSQSYAQTFYIKKAEWSQRIRFSTVSGNVVLSLATTQPTFVSGDSTPTITDVGNGWYRVAIVAVEDLGGSMQVGRIVFQENSGNENFAGDNFSGIYIWGAQFEAAAFATSYIPTVASQVTRNADSASMTGTNFSSWFNTNEGTLYTEGGGEAAVAGRLAGISDGTTSNRIINYLSGATQLAGLISAGGVAQANPTVTVVSAASANKLAQGYLVNNVNIAANGTLGTLDTSATIPAVTLMRIGADEAGTGSFLNGTIRRIIYYPVRLTNTELVAITKQ